MNQAVRAGVSSEALAEACRGLITQLNGFPPLWRDGVETNNGSMTLLVKRLRGIVDSHDGQGAWLSHDRVNAAVVADVPEK